MRINGSDLTQGMEPVGPAKAARASAATVGSESFPTGDLLAISAAATAASWSAGRINQLQLQVDSGEYSQPSLDIAQKLVSGALALTDETI
jgi:hypothetical protein